MRNGRNRMAGRRGPYGKSQVKRELLGRSALRLIQEKGHREVTVAEIAADAGVSEPTVFYHFPSKEGLLIAALQQFDDDHIRPEGAEAGAVADMGPRAEAGVRRTHHARLFAEMAGAAADPAHPANEYFRNRHRRSIRVVSTDIARLQGLGIVPEDVEPAEAAKRILAAWSGLQLQWQHGPEFDIRGALEAVVDAVLGLTPERRAALERDFAAGPGSGREAEVT